MQQYPGKRKKAVCCLSFDHVCTSSLCRLWLINLQPLLLGVECLITLVSFCVMHSRGLSLYLTSQHLMGWHELIPLLPLLLLSRTLPGKRGIMKPKPLQMGHFNDIGTVTKTHIDLHQRSTDCWSTLDRQLTNVTLFHMWTFQPRKTTGRKSICFCMVTKRNNWWLQLHLSMSLWFI